MPLSTYFIQQTLGTLRTGWVALHYENPASNAVRSEVFGGSYSRLNTGFSLPDNGAIWNTSPLRFVGLPPVTVTHVSVWTASTGGNIIAWVAFNKPVSVSDAKTGIVIPEGDLAISIA